MRLEILNPPYEGEDAERVAQWVPPGTDVQPTHSVRLMLRQHPELAAAMHGLGWFLLDPAGATLPVRVRELAVARTTGRAGCEYQWGIHQAVFGEAAGFTDAQRTSTVHGGPDDPIWDERDRAVLRAVDELYETSRLSDAAWAALRAQLPDRSVIELITVVGAFLMNSYWIGVGRPQLESYAVPFPPAPAGPGAG